MGDKRSMRRMNKQERIRMRKKRRRKRVLILSLEVILLLVLGVTAYGVFKFDKINFLSFGKENLEIYRENGAYTNIALFGLDSREGELDKGVRSDCMMIASINNETDEVKVVSVYRDTLLQHQDGSYDKANAAYSYGGPEEAIALLNRNLDLDISTYVSVNFNAVADAVDLLGGITLDLTDEEVFWLNGYAAEVADVTGRARSTELEGAGEHEVDGAQAVGFARIRYTSGSDMKRTERQRIVLEKIMQKAKKSNLSTLNKIVDKVFPQISTNLTVGNILGMASNILSYEIGEMSGFPFNVEPTENVRGMDGSYLASVGHADNVRQLHQFLFEEAEYQPSEKVQAISDDIVYLTGIDSE